MFPGFTAQDFDAYTSNKWKSNVFNRERLEVKQKLLALGRELTDTLTAADGSPLALDASVEHPALWNHKQVEAQHLFASRNEGARKELDAIIDREKTIASMIEDPTPQRNHLFLAISISAPAIEFSVRLHPDARIDRQNVERKCEDHFEREKLLRLLGNLGPGYRAGLLPDPLPASEIDEAKLLSLIASLSAPAPLALPHAPARLLYVGCKLARDEAVGSGTMLLTSARDALSALLPIYRFIAWSRENDFVSIRETLQKEKQAKRQKGLAKNDQVRIVRGLFAGKMGTVQEIDAKGGIKVRVGKLAVKVDVEDVLKG